MIFLAILALVTGSVVWTVLELSLRTFRAASKRKPFIIGFGLAGAVLAIALSVFPLVVDRGTPYGGQVPIIGLAICPSSFAYIVFLDIRHPRFSSLVEVAIFTMVVNAALYAAIGGRVGGLPAKKPPAHD